MVSNDFKEEKEGLLTQMFDESIKGFGIFWVISALTAVLLVMIGVIS
jgi:hypothetical protein